MISSWRSSAPLLLLVAGMALCVLAYAPGLSGGFLFDDFPNIVDNPGVQPAHADGPSLVRAMLSSPSSDLKRPLASLTFALNVLAAGLDPYWMKVTNLVIHLLNGLMVFLVGRRLLNRIGNPETDAGTLSAVIAIAWMVLPINITSVLYVVQRMESLANLAVLGGLYTYLRMRSSMERGRLRLGRTRLFASLLSFTVAGLLAKETAVLLPLYAFVVEWILFQWKVDDGHGIHARDRGLQIAFGFVLCAPLIAGLAWLLPPLLTPSGWAGRDFSLETRLLSEARIVSDYIIWTFAPLPEWLSFYHDDYRISTSLISPWTTLLSVGFLVLLCVVTWQCRRRAPLVSTGIALYLASQTLTGTILPLELVYEHRVYFGTFALLIAVFPLLASVPARLPHQLASLSKARIGWWLMGSMIILWTAVTSSTSFAWGDNIRLARELAARGPQSPRAQYELGRAAIIASRYDPASPFTREAEEALKRAADIPESTILPEQAIIFARARMHLPIDPTWWDRIDARLRAHRPGVQDESSLGALSQCHVQSNCDFDENRLRQAFLIALSHEPASARMLALYGDFAWGVMNDKNTAVDATRRAIDRSPREAAYRISLARRLLASGRFDEADVEIKALQNMDVAGILRDDVGRLQEELRAKRAKAGRP